MDISTNDKVILGSESRFDHLETIIQFKLICQTIFR